MNVSREIKKEEAIRRMKALDLYKPYIESFIKRDEIFMSELTGGVYEFSSNTELVNKVREFEDDHKALVYHVIRTVTVDGEIYSFLFVSDYPEEWGMDNADIADGFAFVYGWDATGWCSEFSSIGVRGKFGGIIRTA